MVKLDKEKKSSYAIFAIIIFLFLIGMGIYSPAYSEISTHHVINDLDSIVYAFNSFLQGDIEGFFDGLLGGVSVLAIFMIVFAITHFLFTTIFKNFFKKHHATLLSVLMGIYALINDKIYNYMISINALGLGLLVFITIIIMLWGFTKKGYKDTKSSFDDLKRPQSTFRADKKKIAELRKAIAEMEKTK